MGRIEKIFFWDESGVAISGEGQGFVSLKRHEVDEGQAFHPFVCLDIQPPQVIFQYAL